MDAHTQHHESRNESRNESQGETRYEARCHAGDDAWSVIDQATGGCAVVGALCFDGLSRDQAERFAETLNQCGRFFEEKG